MKEKKDLAVRKEKVIFENNKLAEKQQHSSLPIPHSFNKAQLINDLTIWAKSYGLPNGAIRQIQVIVEKCSK